MIEVIGTAGLATVQDLGRYGSLRFGVGRAGAMDGVALTLGNLLLGNGEGAAGIEIQVFPFRLRFTAACAFALTGADCAARLDGLPLLPWSAHCAREGQELLLDLPHPGAARAYLALPGGVDVPEVLGSRSTQLRGTFGGLEGRHLRPGDHLRAAAPHAEPGGFGVLPPALAMPSDGIRVLPAAEFCRLRPEAQELLWSVDWKITAQSDRYGYRLAGETLALAEPIEMMSHGIVPGVIQLPHGGQPIIQMSDAQPSGGYPKIGTVIEADLWRLGQAPIGSRIRFKQTEWDAAVAAGDALRAWMDDAARLIRLYRSQGAGR